MNIILDIETIPAQRPDVMEEIRTIKQVELDAALASIAPPGNYKKQETIDEWTANEAPKIAAKLRSACEDHVDEAYRRTGLDGAYGQVCVVGMAQADGFPVKIYESDWQDPQAERRILESLSAQLTEWVKPSDVFTTCIIGHNVAGFDLRFLAQRHIVNHIKPHIVIGRAAQAKPWEGDKVFDTMVQWTGSASVRISLDKLCKALSIPTPKDGGITGATVWDAVQEGRIADVAAYCAGDVLATREAWRRMTYQDQRMAA